MWQGRRIAVAPTQSTLMLDDRLLEHYSDAALKAGHADDVMAAFGAGMKCSENGRVESDQSICAIVEMIRV